MPGAWELVKPSVLVVTLNAKDIVPIRWAYALRELQLPAGSQAIWLSGTTYDHGRNMGCRHTLEHGFQWCFFVDDDCVVPPDGLMKLLARNLPIVSGLYYRRHNPVVPVMLNKNTQSGQSGGTWITDFTPGSLVEADWVGAGCLLINRFVLEKLADPLQSRWFRWMMDDSIPVEQRMSEDFYFCEQARNILKIRPVVDTSVVCEHIGIGAAKAPGQFAPMNA